MHLTWVMTRRGRHIMHYPGSTSTTRRLNRRPCGHFAASRGPMWDPPFLYRAMHAFIPINLGSVVCCSRRLARNGRINKS
jgi:hypothetical protein